MTKILKHPVQIEKYLLQDNIFIDINVVSKTVNFRSCPKIINVLNKIRPDLQQITAIDGFDGEVYVVDCNDFNGERREDRQFKGHLPAKILNERLNKLEEIFYKENETSKTLMITHKVLANHQHYENLLNILGEGLKDLSNNLFNFVVDVIDLLHI